MNSTIQSTLISEDYREGELISLLRFTLAEQETSLTPVELAFQRVSLYGFSGVNAAWREIEMALNYIQAHENSFAVEFTSFLKRWHSHLGDRRETLVTEQMVYCPPGEVRMSDTYVRTVFHEDRESSGTKKFEKGFLLQSTPVTQEQWMEVASYNPSTFADKPLAAMRPVEGVSWYEAIWFCNLLSQREGLTEVYHYHHVQEEPGSNFFLFVWNEWIWRLPVTGCHWR